MSQNVIKNGEYLIVDNPTSTYSLKQRYRILINFVHSSPQARRSIIDKLQSIKTYRRLSQAEHKIFDLCMNYDKYLKDHQEKVVQISYFIEKRFQKVGQ